MREGSAVTMKKKIVFSFGARMFIMNRFIDS
jgi:hypothetical protein